MPFFIQQDHGVRVLRLLVAITLEVCEVIVKSCDVCVQTKNLCFRPHDLLKPLSIPASIWFSISIDFIINLSPFSSYDSILVVVDHLTKMVHFILCTKTIIGERIVELLFDHDFQYHGLPKYIIFDHGLQFVSKF